jgi:hypothetical protein
MLLQSLAQASYDALVGLWQGFINFIPTLIGGLIIFLVGVVIGNGVAQLIEKIIEIIKLDKALEKAGVKEFTDRANISLNSGYFLGQLVKWLIILSFLVAACNIWGLTAVGEFLRSVVNFLPRLIVAVLIMLAAIVLGEYFARFVKASVAGSGLKFQGFLASLARWAFYIFGLLAALSQLQVATYIINTLFTGIVAMLALAGGLAFGLGGKELAQEMLRKFKEELEK